MPCVRSENPYPMVFNSLLASVPAPPGEDGRLGFAHRLFQEFFLGLAISEGLFDAADLVILESVSELIRRVCQRRSNTFGRGRGHGAPHLHLSLPANLRLPGHSQGLFRA